MVRDTVAAGAATYQRDVPKLLRGEAMSWLKKLLKAEVEVKPEPSVVILGYEFFPMTKEDWYGYAGAESGTLICHLKNGGDLLWDPRAELLHEFAATPWTLNGVTCRMWSFIKVME